MTYSSSDFQRLGEMEEEYRQRAAEAALERFRTDQQAESAEADDETNEIQSRQEIREATADVTAAQKQRGLVSEVGDFVIDNQQDAYLDPLNIANNAAAVLNAVIPESMPGLKQQTQRLDDFVPNRREYNERMEEAAAGGNKLAELQVALDRGVIAGSIGLPFTIAAKVTDQEAKWSRRPEALKDSPVGEAVFNIAEVVTPTLIGGGILGLAGKGALATSGTALVAESALETGLQGDQDELIASRTVAVEMGNIAQYLGLDGEQLTRDLLEDKKPDAKVLNTTLSFIQNLGINFGANQIIKAAGSARRTATKAKVEPTEEAVQIGEILASSPESIQKNLDNVEMPAYRPDAEPTDVIDISTGTAAPTKTYISEPAAVAEALRKSGIAEDGLTSADRKYFTNWKAVTEEVGIENVMKEASSTLKKLRDFPSDFKFALQRAEDWWSTNRELLDTNIDGAIGNFQQEMVTLTKAGEAVATITDDFYKNSEKYLKEYSVVTEEGFLAAALVGEELGVRIQKLARQAVNLENADEAIDFTNVVEQMLTMHDKLNLFLIPLRRGKRKWAIEGMAQQRKTIESLKDADVQGAIRKRQPVDWDEAAKEFEKVNFNDVDPGVSLRTLWEKYQAGDQIAGQYLKTYMETVAYVDPRSVVGAVDNLSQVVKNQLDKANLDANQALYYQFLLTRLRPQVASIGSNVARLILEPMGAVLAGERAYGMGQLVGGWSALSDGMAVFKESFQNGTVLNSGSKFNNIESLKANMALEESLWKAVQQDLTKKNASKAEVFGAWVNHNRRMLANHPLSNIAMRGLTAGDEATKAIFAAQVATGRAYQFAAKTNTWDIIDNHIKSNMNAVFRDGIKTNKIIDDDVLGGAKTLTFQNDIPTDGNFVDDLFLAAQAGTENSSIFRWFNPFPRLGYNVLEQSGRFLAGSIPGGGEAMMRLIPRYRAIYNGEMGDVAMLQFKSQLALAKGLAATATGVAAFGFMTGANSGSMPKQSFIVPMPNTKEGYIAIPYGKIEPYATVLTFVADLVNGLRDEVISEGDYEKYMAGLVLSLGIASTDKTFQQGLVNMGSLLSVKNMGEKSLKSLSSTFGTVTGSQLTGAAGGVLRMMLDNLQPYQTNAINPDNPIGSMIRGMQQRLLGGVGLPPKVDPLTGRNIPKVSSLGTEDNYWAAITSSFINEAVYPGQIKDAPKVNKVKQELDRIGFKFPRDYDKRYKGIAMTPEEQTQFARGQFEAGLPQALLNVIQSREYVRLENQFRNARSKTPMGNTGSGTLADVYRQRQHKLLLKEIDDVRKTVFWEIMPVEFRMKYQGTSMLEELWNRDTSMDTDIQDVLSLNNPGYA